VPEESSIAGRGGGGGGGLVLDGKEISKEKEAQLIAERDRVHALTQKERDEELAAWSLGFNKEICEKQSNGGGQANNSKMKRGKCPTRHSMYLINSHQSTLIE